MLLEGLIEPKEVISSGDIKIYLEGVDFRSEQYIEAPKVRQILNQEDAEEVGAEIASRLIRNVVKKIEGVDLKIDGKIEPFVLEFDEKGQITLKSYTIFMRVLNHAPDLIIKIHEFYSKSIKLEGIETKKKPTAES